MLSPMKLISHRLVNGKQLQYQKDWPVALPRRPIRLFFHVEQRSELCFLNTWRLPKVPRL